jgi:hypothetical protein
MDTNGATDATHDTQTDTPRDAEISEIRIGYPAADNLHLRITVGPGRLRLAPGSEEEWVAGTYRDPTGSLPCRVVEEGGEARIGQQYGLPRSFKGMPEFDLRLGTERPFALTVEAGAGDGSVLNVGGVPLTRLDVKHGAGEARLDFSAPNPVEMGRLHLAAGAARTEAVDLANANAAEIAFEGGAGAFVLDFSGTLRRDTRVTLTAGMASIELRVPGTTAARINPRTTLGSVEPADGFTTRDGGYWTAAAVAGETPVLTIEATVALGSLKLRPT